MVCMILPTTVLAFRTVSDFLPLLRLAHLPAGFGGGIGTDKTTAVWRFYAVDLPGRCSYIHSESTE